MRPGQENQDGPPIHGNTRLEVVWTAIPSLIIACLVIYAYLVLDDIEKAPANAAQEMHVKVIGEQFTWHFEYPQAGGKAVKSDQLYLPIDKSVKFDIVSKDVLHDFWVPAFRMKIDAVPGITTHYRVTPNKLGDYPVVCAELCGLGHAFMRQTAHVLSAEDFDAWLAKQKAPAAQAGASTGEESAGAAVDAKALFAGDDFGCGACHTLADAGTTGTTGPDLGKVLVGQDAAKIREDIVTPDKEIAKGYPGGIMPQDFGERLTTEQLDALVKYLDEVTK
jgi:cytochrome c oxidase subunit 2